MNEQEVREVFERLERLGASTAYEVHPDYALEMPQSDERIRPRQPAGRQHAYPNPPTIQRSRWSAPATCGWSRPNDYGGGQLYHVIDIVEYRDGKIWRETRYYAEPFQAPQWRTQWVEPMEQAPTPAGPAPLG